jgi:hypothetical protein
MSLQSGSEGRRQPARLCWTCSTRLHDFFWMINTNSAPTSQETHYVSATETKTLMLFGELSLFVVRNIRNREIQYIPHRKHNTSSLQRPTGSCLLWETYGIHKFSAYLTGNTIHHLYRDQPVAVYCENHTEHTKPVLTSQGTHYVSDTETNRLMLFRETVAVYCENHTGHRSTVRTSQETHYITTTETNR